MTCFPRSRRQLPLEELAQLSPLDRWRLEQEIAKKSVQGAMNRKPSASCSPRRSIHNSINSLRRTLGLPPLSHSWRTNEVLPHLPISTTTAAGAAALPFTTDDHDFKDALSEIVGETKEEILKKKKDIIIDPTKGTQTDMTLRDDFEFRNLLESLPLSSPLWIQILNLAKMKEKEKEEELRLFEIRSTDTVLEILDERQLTTSASAVKPFQEEDFHSTIANEMKIEQEKTEITEFVPPSPPPPPLKDSEVVESIVRRSALEHLIISKGMKAARSPPLPKGIKVGSASLPSSRMSSNSVLVCVHTAPAASQMPKSASVASGVKLYKAIN